MYRRVHKVPGELIASICFACTWSTMRCVQGENITATTWAPPSPMHKHLKPQQWTWGSISETTKCQEAERGWRGVKQLKQRPVMGERTGAVGVNGPSHHWREGAISWWWATFSHRCNNGRNDPLIDCDWYVQAISYPQNKDEFKAFDKQTKPTAVISIKNQILGLNLSFLDFLLFYLKVICR